MFYHKTDRTGKTSGLKSPSRTLKPESVTLEIKRRGMFLRQSHCVLGGPYTSTQQKAGPQLAILLPKASEVVITDRKDVGYLKANT